MGGRRRIAFLRFFSFFPFWYGVKAALAKGIATQKTPEAQSKAYKKTPFLKRLYGVRRACGRKTTRGPFFKRRNIFLI